MSAQFRECRPFEDAAGQARMVDYAARNWNACHPAAGENPCYTERREALQRRQLVVAGPRLAQVLEKVFP